MTNDVYGGQVYSLVSNRWVAPMVCEWENFMKVPRPEGCEIHHIDGNKLNNNILNLVCMTEHDHKSWHGKNISEDTKIKRRNKMNGHKVSEETRKKYLNLKKVNLFLKRLGKNHLKLKRVTRYLKKQERNCLNLIRES